MPTQSEVQSADQGSEAGDLSVMEEAGIAFDPTSQHIDLTKDEKRRTTALLMAISAYKELIIKDGAYLAEASRLAKRDEGPKLRPATIDAMIVAAIKFDGFIAGNVEISDISDGAGVSDDETDNESAVMARARDTGEQPCP